MDSEGPQAGDHAIMQALMGRRDIGVIQMGPDLRVLRGSSVHPEYFRGLTAAPGTRWADLVPEGDTAGADVLRGVLATGRPVLALTQPMRPDGALITALSVLPLRDDDGDICGLLLVILDTTRSHRVQETADVIGESLNVAETSRRLADGVVQLGIGSRATVNLAPEVSVGADPPIRHPDDVGLRRAAMTCAAGLSWPDGFLHPGQRLPRLPSTEAVEDHLRLRPVRLPSRDAVVEALAGDPDLVRQLIPGAVRGLIHCPLHVRGRLLGSVEVWREADEPAFADGDTEALSVLASRAAVTIDNARVYERERAANIQLQRSLLPAPSARSLAAEAEGVYLPTTADATGAGGDWYDCIQLPGCRAAFVVGDVVGHGLHATAAMARLRAAVNSLADIELPPDELLAHLDDLVLRLASDDDDRSPHESAVGSTCLYAVYDPVARRCAMASAGHPPPVLVVPGGAAALVDLDPGPPLGIGGHPFEVTEIDMPPDSVLALYTDGLVQPTRGDIGEGIEALRVDLDRLAPTAAHCDLRAAGERLVKGAAKRAPLPDDVTLLLVRVRAVADENLAAWQIPDDPAAVADMRDLATRQLTAWGIETFTTELVVSELVTNAIRYGNGPGALRLIRDGSALVVEVSDHSNSHPHLRRAHRDDEGGRGLAIVAQLVDRWGSRYTREGKTIWAEVPGASRRTAVAW